MLKILFLLFLCFRHSIIKCLKFSSLLYWLRFGVCLTLILFRYDPQTAWLVLKSIFRHVSSVYSAPGLKKKPHGCPGTLGHHRFLKIPFLITVIIYFPGFKRSTCNVIFKFTGLILYLRPHQFSLAKEATPQLHYL